MVADGWKAKVVGLKLFSVVSKMSLLKRPIRKLMWEKGDIHTHVIK